MSLIKNLVKEPERKFKRSKKGSAAADEEEPKDEDEEKKPTRPIVKSVTDLQRLKLEKLMKNPDKPIFIPEQRKEKDHLQSVPTFVRNVMGSSAGAGSGEFHVYRHLRRKEYARQKAIQSKSTREQMDDDFHNKLEENKRIADEKTAKKRAKRLKKKQRQRNAKRTRPSDQQSEQNKNQTDTSESDDDHEDDDKPLKNNEQATLKKPEDEEEQTADNTNSSNNDVNEQESIAPDAPPSPQEAL